MPAKVSRSEVLIGLGLLTLLLLGYLVYRPGIPGPLLLDDFWNLEPIGANGGVKTFEQLRLFVFGNTSGPTGRPVSMLSFLIDVQDWPLYVPALKYTNILIHLLCGVLVFWFSLLLAQLLDCSRRVSAEIALICTAIWLLHPLNGSTVLYVIQRMTQLMTLFALASLVCYLGARLCLQSKPRRAAILLCLSLFPFGLLSVLSKENGALLLLAIVIMELLFFNKRQANQFFKLWYRIGVLLPVSIIFAYLIYSLPDNIDYYEFRNFSMGERLLTESRIVVSYIWNILLPGTVDNHLYHDDLTVSTGLLQPVTTLLSILVLSALLGSAIYSARRQPVYSFAVLWFFVLHLLESSYIPLELYFEHRNYLPMIGPVFAIAWYLRKLIGRQAEKQVAEPLVIGTVLVLVFTAWLSWSQSRLWGDPLMLNSTWAESQPRSVRAQIVFAEYLNVIGLPELAMERLEMARNNYPQEVTILLQMWNQACEFGLPKPFTLQSINDIENLEFYFNDVNYHLEILLENMRAERCQFPEIAVLEELFEEVDRIQVQDGRRAHFLTLYAELYVQAGLLDQALINLTRAYEFSSSPRIRIRQAVLSASAGNYADALVFLDRAEEVDEADNPFLPSFAEEIDTLRQDFMSRL